MRLVCLSDLHGQLPENLPVADILLIAGDICPVFDHSYGFQKCWLETNFTEWIKKTQKRIPNVVYIAGNHDFIFEKVKYRPGPHVTWNDRFSVRVMDKVYYLQDEGIKIGNLKIWGTPWQKRYFDWAFNLDEPQLAEKWQLIPSDTDIILCHGPAYGYGDAVLSRNGDEEKWPEIEHVGSPSMLKKIDEINPKLYVCGHIHSGYGIKMRGETTLVNASYVNEQYKPVNKPIVVEI